MALDLEELLKNITEKMPEEGITINDLKKPSTEFMMRYFLKVIVELGMADTTQTVLQRIANPEMYKDSIQFSMVYRVLRKIYPIPEHLKGFSILSLMEPKAEDIRYVWYVDAYFDFYYQRTMQLLIPKANEIVELENELEILKNKREALQTKLNMMTVEHAKINQDADKVEDNILLLCNQLEEIKIRNRKKTEELELMEKKKAFLQEALHAKVQEVQEISARAELCREKEQLEACLSQTTEELQKQKEVLIELEQKKADKMEQQKFYEEAIVQEREFKELLLKLKELYKAEKQVHNVIIQLEEKVETLKEQLKENQVKIENHQQRRDKAVQELRNFIAQNKKNVSSQRKILSSLQKQEKEAENKLRSSQSIHERCKLKIQQMEAALLKEKDQRTMLDRQYREGCDVIHGKLNKFQEVMDKKLQR